MSLLFTGIKINSLNVPNRFFRAPTFEALSNTNGACTNEIIDLYKQFKNVGFIMSSCTQVDDRGRHHPTMLSLAPRSVYLSNGQFNEEHLKTFSKLADEIHNQGQCFGVQLAHPGMISKKPLINGLDPETPDTMSVSDINRVIDNFSNAAHFAYSHGADAVEIHASSVFLVGSFLSSVTNHRNDDFGGSVEKRSEIMRRIIQQIRTKVPSTFPVLVKINGGSEKSFIPPEEQAIIAKIAENSGVDAIEIAVEHKIKNKSTRDFSSYFSSFNQEIVKIATKSKYDYSAVACARKVISIPIISTGGHLELKKMNSFVNGGLCNMIGLSRPLVRQPNLVDLFKNRLSHRSTCKQCNGCLDYTSVKENPIKCVNP